MKPVGKQHLMRFVGCEFFPLFIIVYLKHRFLNLKACRAVSIERVSKTRILLCYQWSIELRVDRQRYIKVDRKLDSVDVQQTYVDR